MVCEKGFNELDIFLLSHLMDENRPFIIVRSKCDASITGILDDEVILNAIFGCSNVGEGYWWKRSALSEFYVCR